MDMAGTIPAASGAYMLTIGDIGLTPASIVTPVGVGPLTGSQWIITDRSFYVRQLPVRAIVVAILFIWLCLLSLLFLLVRQPRLTGWVDVTVASGNVAHTTSIAVSRVEHVGIVRQQVATAQAIAVQAST